jgi:uncharacterized protein
VPTLTGIHVYPIKGLRGIDLPSAGVEARGLEYDRRWMLVDGTGRFISQRTDSRLCLFKPSLGSSAMAITGPDGDQIEIPYEATGSRIPVTVWSSELEAQLVSETADRWFSSSLGLPVRLVAMPNDIVRQTRLDYSQPGDQVGFADAFPILVLSLASMDDLNHRLDEPLPLNRFRANLIVDGCAPFEEDSWPKVQIGTVRLRAAKKCGRCLVTTTNQDTSEVGQEPLRTLATYRKEDGNVMFGAYFIPENEARIAVGERVNISA